MILWSLGMVKSPPGSEGQASASAGAGETLSTSVWGLTSPSAQTMPLPSVPYCCSPLTRQIQGEVRGNG